MNLRHGQKTMMCLYVSFRHLSQSFYNISKKYVAM